MSLVLPPNSPVETACGLAADEAACPLGRRGFLLGTAGGLLGAIGVGSQPSVWAAGEATPSTDSRSMVSPETEEAIQRGLKWLVGRQQEGGNFGLRSSFSRYQLNPAVNSLCGLALLSSGSTPGRGPYGAAIQRLTDFVLSCAKSTGYLVEEDISYYDAPMYGHGFALLYLAEVYGMSPGNRVRESLHRGVQLTIATQNREGGWRYAPEPKEADISVTACQVMALRAAHNAGIAVPRTTIDRCIEYLRKSQNPDGGFRYQLLTGSESRFPRSAAALTALHSCGVHDGPEVESARRYLHQFRPGQPATRERGYYFYAHYYAIQAAWHAGGELWDEWYPAIRDEMLAMQLANGSWTDQGISAEYATAMCLIVLQTPNNYLPIFQR
ncbi:MAG: prenyltransferase/squalene oxidase repeat-containing protein [Planctomycetaceae bacterium]